MESLPNSFFQQEPVVFFSSGPPTHDFQHGHGPRNHHRHGRCGGGPGFSQQGASNGFSFSFLKPLAMSILSLFALSMLVRTVLFLLAVVFSPPVLLLCLFVMVMSQGGRYHDYWNTRDFQQCFHNPRRRFRRFFANGNHCGNRRGQWRAAATSGRTSSNTDQPNTTPAMPPTAFTRPGPSSPTPAEEDRPTGQGTDFELISPFNLMMAAAAAAESASNSNSTDKAGSNTPTNDPTTEEEPKNTPPRSSSPAQRQTVPVHRKETDEALTIAMDISGFNVANIHIKVENDVLCIHGERTNKIGDSFLVEECFDLDEERFDEETIQANASDGVLEVTVQKKAAPQPRVITIQTDEKVE